MEQLRSALVVLVPEAEPAVGQWRLELDPSARLGLPAHVTVLFPFVPAGEINAGVLTRTAALFRPVPAFTHQLIRSDWFGDQVLWLASDASDKFRSLTNLAWKEFPTCPPYGGQFDDVIPHLTIGAGAPLDAMRTAEQSIQAHLPIPATAHAVTLVVEHPSGHWHPAATFPLAG